MRLRDLVLLGAPDRQSSATVTDALREAHSMQEAELLSTYVDRLTSSAGLLIDCRSALDFPEGNTAVVVVRGMRSLLWSQDLAGPGNRGLAPSSCEWHVGSGSGSARRRFHQITARAAEFFLGDVAGIGEAPPDCTEVDDQEICVIFASRM